MISKEGYLYICYYHNPYNYYNHNYYNRFLVSCCVKGNVMIHNQNEEQVGEEKQTEHTVL